VTPNPVLKRYADALLAAAANTGELESVDAWVRAIGEVSSERSVVDRLFDPALSRRERKERVHDFASDVPHVFRNFLLVLIDKNRIAILRELPAVWDRCLKAARRFSDAEICFSSEPDESMKQSVRRYLERVMPGVEFRVRYRVDPSLIGGFRVRTENRIYDMSLLGRITRLRETLLK
jgi:F-type H+-transporting ATPase subunit delta